MKLRLLLSVVALVCTSSQAANWVKVYDNGRDQGFVDLDSRETVKGQERVWTRWTFSQKQFRPAVEPFQSYVRLKFYNCDRKTYATKKTTAYAGPNWTGQVVYAAEYPSANHDEGDIAPMIKMPDAQPLLTKIVCDHYKIS